MNPTQNKYLADRSLQRLEDVERWTLVVSSDPALLATLHCVADDHYIGLRPESSLSGLLHDAALI